MKVFKIDVNGYFVEEIHLEEMEQIPDDCTETPLPIDEYNHQLPFYRPRWTGEKWVEGMTQEEIDISKKPKVPLLDDFLLDFEFRLSTLELGLQEG